MDYDFDYSYKKEIYKKYQETYSKQLKNSKKILMIVFYFCSVLYGGLSVLLYFIEKETQEPAIVLSILSGVFLLVAFIITVLPFNKVPDYDKYKKRIEKCGTYSMYDLIARIDVLEKRIEDLEDKMR